MDLINTQETITPEKLQEVPSAIVKREGIVSTMLKDYTEDEKTRSPSGEHISPYYSFHSPKDNSSVQKLQLMTFHKSQVEQLSPFVNSRHQSSKKQPMPKIIVPIRGVGYV